MFLTARQLEDLHRANGSNGHLVLPYRARLTPLAADWVRARKIALGYSDDGAQPGNGNVPATGAATPLAVSHGGAATASTNLAAGSSAGAILWWCDGPCGPAKA